MQNVKVLNIHGGSIEVGWDALAGATGYKVYYKTEGGSWTYGGKTGKTTYKKRVTGLNPKTEYQFMVCGTAKAKSGKKISGNFSEVTAASTGTTAIEDVSYMDFSPVSSTSLKLTWPKVVDATQYQVYLEDPKNPGWKKKATVTTNTVTLEKLGANKTYNFKVRAIIKRNNITDTGAFSPDITGYTAPAKVTGLAAGSIGKNSLTLKWKKSAGADGYLVQYYGPGGAWTDNEIPVSGTTSVVISGLTQNTKYTFRVIPWGYEDFTELWGNPSAKYAVTTLK